MLPLLPSSILDPLFSISLLFLCALCILCGESSRYFNPGDAVTRPFRVALTRDFLKADGTPGFGDIGLNLLDRAGIAWEYLAEKTPELRADQVRDFDALLL